MPSSYANSQLHTPIKSDLVFQSYAIHSYMFGHAMKGQVWNYSRDTKVNQHRPLHASATNKVHLQTHQA